MIDDTVIADIVAPPVQVGQLYCMEPLYNAAGTLRAVAIVDPATDAIVQVVPPEAVTFADPTTTA